MELRKSELWVKRLRTGLRPTFHQPTSNQANYIFENLYDTEKKKQGLVYINWRILFKFRRRFNIDNRQRIPKGNQNGHSGETTKNGARYTRRRKTKQKHNIIQCATKDKHK